jgi:hypothetical protein
MTDIIVSGAGCTWWDSIEKTANSGPGRSGIPLCPHCRGVLFQHDNEAAYVKGISTYEAAGHPGYGDMVMWGRGKCFRGLTAMREAYAAETGIIVP